MLAAVDVVGPLNNTNDATVKTTFISSATQHSEPNIDAICNAHQEPPALRKQWLLSSNQHTKMHTTPAAPF